MGGGLLAVKSGFILFIKDYQFFTKKTHLREKSHVSNVFSKRNVSYWIVRVLTFADFG